MIDDLHPDLEKPASRGHVRHGVTTLLAAVASALVLTGAARSSGWRDDLKRIAGTPADRVVRTADSTAGAWQNSKANADTLMSQLEALGNLVLTIDPYALEPVRAWLGAGVSRLIAEHGAGDRRLIGPLSNLAILDDYLGLDREADSLESRSLAIRRRVSPRDTVAIAASRLRIATYAYWRSDFAHALDEASTALGLLRRLGPDADSLRIEALNAHGEICRALDRAIEAEHSFHEALALVESPDSEQRLRLLNNLAGVYKDLARFDEAEPMLEESLRLRVLRHPGDLESIGTGHLNLAEVRRLQGRVAGVGAHYDSALVLIERRFGPENPVLVPYLNQASVFYREQREFDRADSLSSAAERLIAREIDGDDAWHAAVLDDRALLLEAEGRDSAAVATCRQAWIERRNVLGNHHSESAAASIRFAGAVARLAAGHEEDPDSLLTSAIGDLRAVGLNPEALLEGYVERARVRSAAGDAVGAGMDFESAMGLADTVRAGRGGGDRVRAKYLSRLQDLYDEVARWHAGRGQVDESYAAHERGHARVLLDQVQAAGIRLESTLPPAVRDSLAALELRARLHLASAEAAIASGPRGEPDSLRESTYAAALLTRDQAAEDLQSIAGTIQDRSPIWRDLLLRNGDVASASEVARWASSARTGVLEYHLGTGASILFVFQPGDLTARIVPLQVDAGAARILEMQAGPLRSGDLAAALGELIEPALATTPASVQRGGLRDSLTMRLRALHRTLVPDSLWSDIRKLDQVEIIPDGALGLLPFEALVTRQDSGPAGATSFWLDDGPAIAYGASGTALVRLADRARERVTARATRSILSVVNPRYETGERGRALPMLPWSEEEARALVHEFGVAEVEVVSGDLARESTVRRAISGRRWIHFGVHGFAGSEGRELLAGLMLTSPPPGAPLDPVDDGVLHLDEIYSLAAPCQLAILSACETDAGPIVSGEGAIALSRGFLAAGADRVVGTLWPIRDEFAARTVGELAHRMAPSLGGVAAPSYACALRDAKRVARGVMGLEGPATWAAPVLLGLP